MMIHSSLLSAIQTVGRDAHIPPSKVMQMMYFCT